MLEEGEIERVGGGRPIAVDVRVVVATHRNLEEQVRQGTFREDLYHRVFVFPIVLPPLRERREDIPRARRAFLQTSWRSRITGSRRHFRRRRSRRWKRYAWPGNVRELRNVVERVLLYATGDVVEAGTIARALPQASPRLGARIGICGAATVGTLAERVESFERETLLAELKRNHHHMTNTAKALGLERSHLYKKCQQLGIDLRSIRQTD